MPAFTKVIMLISIRRRLIRLNRLEDRLLISTLISDATSRRSWTFGRRNGRSLVPTLYFWDLRIISGSYGILK